MKLRIILLFILGAFYTQSHAQSTRFVNPSTPFASFNFGPMTTNTLDSTASRFAYILPSITLGQMQQGDTIRSIEFSMATVGNSITNANMKIYMAGYTSDNFGTNNIHWDSTIAQSNAVMVYNGNPSNALGSTPGFKTIHFNQNNFALDTNGGKYHIALFIEYFQTTGCSGTITWRYETPAFFAGYAPNQMKSWTGKYPFPDSTNQSSGNHPEMALNFPRNGNDLSVQNIYALGKIPVNNAADETIRARVKNTGAYAANSSSKVILNISGLNAYTDTISLAGLPSFKDTMVEFTGVNPTKITAENIEVKVTNDDDPSNDQQNITRFVTQNVFNHADPTTGASGGIGFAGGTGDFVAKFETDGSTTINQVKVRFTAAGRDFQLGIWGDNNGVPGTNIHTSDSLVTSDSIYIVKIDPPVTVNGVFYVGVRQTGTVNVAFGYQAEDPVRPDAFFFTGPIGSTNWTPFSPGFNFKMMIEPRMQVAHDVAIEKIIPPFSNGGLVYYDPSDTLAPKALLANYGSLDQNTPFNIVCNIRKGGFLIYSDTITDTIAANHVKQIEFAKEFIPANLGVHECEIFTDLHLDLATDNDNLKENFRVVIQNDIGADIIFTPTPSDTFEMTLDTIQPIIRIQNWGTNTQPGFIIVFQVLAGDTVVYEQTKAESINPELTKIVPLDSFVCDTFGILTMRAFTTLPQDEVRANDTIYGTLHIRKSADVAMLNIYRPKNDSVFVRSSVGFKPQVTISNVGTAFQDSVYVHLKIFDENKNEVYNERLYQPINILSSRLVTYPIEFVPDVVGKYDILAFISLKGDQDNRNDTMRSSFWVKVGKDVRVNEIVLPEPNVRLNQSYTPFNPKVTIENRGILITDSFDITMVISKGANVVYQSTKRDELDISEIKDIEFDIFNLTDLGNYKVKVFTELVDDELTENDSLESSFVISRFFDVGTRSFVNPISQKTYPFENTIPLEIEVQSYGEDTGKQTFDLHVVIEVGFTEVYNEFTSVTLDSGENKDVLMPVDFEPTNSGGHVIRAYTTLSTDQRLSNDTITDSFVIDKKAGVENIVHDNSFVVYPNPFGTSIKLDAITNDIGSVSVTITNSLGVTIYSDEEADLTDTYTITGLDDIPAGFYFVTISTEKGTYRYKLSKPSN